MGPSKSSITYMGYLCPCCIQTYLGVILSQFLQKYDFQNVASSRLMIL